MHVRPPRYKEEIITCVGNREDWIPENLEGGDLFIFIICFRGYENP